jgi:hypothetical protein
MVRIRKRESLSAGHQYCDSKYDAAFEQGVMSDDEDKLDADGKRTGVFLSQQLVCASDEVSHTLSIIQSHIE